MRKFLRLLVIAAALLAGLSGSVAAAAPSGEASGLDVAHPGHSILDFLIPGGAGCGGG